MDSVKKSKFIVFASVGIFAVAMLLLVVMGIAMSALFDAGIQYLNISNSANVQTILLWLTGSVWGRYWDERYRNKRNY